MKQRFPFFRSDELNRENHKWVELLALPIFFAGWFGKNLNSGERGFFQKEYLCFKK
ncbi:hypothetical protein AF78_03615 [Aliarcobacter butzleri L353]|nr:hypothetical protein AF78_03615 [Aliarcobacter butzleri L353]